MVVKRKVIIPLSKLIGRTIFGSVERAFEGCWSQVEVLTWIADSRFKKIKLNRVDNILSSIYSLEDATFDSTKLCIRSRGEKFCELNHKSYKLQINMPLYTNSAHHIARKTEKQSNLAS